MKNKCANFKKKKKTHKELIKKFLGMIFFIMNAEKR